MGRWLDMWADVGRVLVPVLGRERAPFTYVNDRFAASVAALESYSTLASKHGERAISKETMKDRLGHIKKALADSPDNLRTWALKGLAYADRFTLRERLELLFDASGHVGEILVHSDRDKFIDEATASRNQYAHNLADRGIRAGGNLHWAHRGLIWLLRYHLLVDLGFDPSEASRRVTENTTFQQEAARMRFDLGLCATDNPSSHDPGS